MARWFWVLGLVWSGVACGDDDSVPVTCTPGTTITCACPTGTGRLVCNDEGTGYGDCSCDAGDARIPQPDGGVSPSDAGAGCDVTVGEEVFLDTCSGSSICSCEPASCDTLGCSICASLGTCEAALPRRYRIVPFSAEVPTRNPEGESWDVGGGAPDLYATVSVDGTPVIEATAAGTDTFSVQWTGALGDTTLVGGSRILVTVLDRDELDADDPAFLCEWSVSPELLRGRILVCGGELGTFLGTIVPL